MHRPQKRYNTSVTDSEPHQLQSYWKILRYRDLVKIDAPVWTNSICNKLGRLYQRWKTHAGTDTIEFIFYKDKPKDKNATYSRSVYDNIPHKTETHSTRLAAGGNLIGYTGDASTPTS